MTATQESIAEREIVITRTIDAPRELVFQIWTDPKHIGKWFGPRGFTTTIHEMDVRPGGVWRLTMHGPDGTDYRNRIVYVKVEPPGLLVYKNVPEHGDVPVHFESTVTFAEHAGKTHLTLRMLFPTVEEKTFVVEKHHAIEGGHQTLARLAELAEGFGEGCEVVIERTLDAPRDVVFKAWTDPQHLKHWWGPTGFTNPRCEVDLRPGGAIRIDMRAPDGVIYPMTGAFEEIVENERLVFTSAALDNEGNPLFQNLNTITFAAHGRQTKLTVRAKVVMATAGAPRYLVGMEEGWSLSLDRLADYSKR